LRGVLLFVAVSFGVFTRGVESVDFDKLAPGSAPSDWSYATTHRGQPGRWVIHNDVGAPSPPNVFAQLSADRVPFRYALALYDKGYCKNGDLSAEMKIISGKSTQTGGLVWRYQDPDNYYLLTVSADEDTIAAVKVHDGRPTPIAKLGPGLRAFQVSHKIEPQEWNVLRVTFQSTHMTVYFDHRKVMDAEDATIEKPGKTGLWTRGDTIAYFDNFRIEKRKD
jgi:Domain of Unknown Function (DUF1080)